MCYGFGLALAVTARDALRIVSESNEARVISIGPWQIGRLGTLAGPESNDF